MTKIELTIDMADTLREMRLQKKIASKDIAIELGRSPSYFSKLEKGSIKSISAEELDRILILLLPDLDTPGKRIEAFAQFHLKKYGVEADQKVWFANIDKVYRQIPIPNGLIVDVNELLVEHKISIESLVYRINLNEELCEEDLNNIELSVNELFLCSDDGSIAAKMELELNYVRDILEGKIKVCNYLSMQAIVYYLFKMILFPADHIFSDNDWIRLQKEWEGLLDKHKFFTLTRKELLLSHARSKSETQNILNEFDIENQGVINTLLSYLKLASDMNIVATTEALKQLINNFEWDYNFMIKLFGFDFASIEECSYTNKVEMLKEIKEILSKYRNMPIEQKRAESYEYID